jgi:DNA-binding CsgD family transcriptional regulator
MDKNIQKRIKPSLTKSDIDKLCIYTWVKDIKFRFISCSDNLSDLAGEDSPGGMIGKDDFSLIWQKDADFFRDKDNRIITNELKYINIVETIDVVTENGIDKQHILITKAPIFNKKGKCVGIAGSHLNLPSYEIAPDTDNSFDENGRLWLPSNLGNEYLTKKEVVILKLILIGKTSKQIAKHTSLSFRTIEKYTDRIKRKLQCSSKFEIHAMAVEYGITHIL